MKICILRTDRMGDMLLTLPVILSLKISNPGSEIHVVCSKKNYKVIKDVNYIDKIFKINGDLTSFIKNIVKIRKNKYHYIVNFTPGIKNIVLSIFIRSLNKANLILLSRYRKNFLSKLFTKILSKFFFDTVHIVDRYNRLKNKKNLHQTNMMFDLIKICKIKFKQNVNTVISLPKKKLSFFKKKTIVVHINERWLNNSYSEKNLIELISKIHKKKYLVVLTSDSTCKNKFHDIYKKYKVILNSNFTKIKKLKNNPVLFNNLDYNYWLKTIYSASAVITPECGCSHIAAACKVPVNIIYDHTNYPQAINNEYAPWKSKYNKFTFGDKKLNEKIILSI